MKEYQIFCTVLFSLLCSGCVKELCDDDEKLSITYQEYNGNLKLNGYYMAFVQESSYEHYHIIFLAKNGVMYNAKTSLTPEEFEQTFQSHGFNVEYKYKWGRFVVVPSTELILQGWMVDMCRKRTYKLTGTVVNDSTFTITNYILEDEYQSIQREYNFVEFHLKPDSLNSFVN